MSTAAAGQAPDGAPTPTSAKRVEALAFVEQANRCDTKNLKCRVSAFTKAVDADAYFAEAYYGRGVTYRADGENERAIADFTKVIELDPRSGQAFFNRGSLLAGKMNLSAAIADLDKAVELLPSAAPVFVTGFCVWPAREPVARLPACRTRDLAVGACAAG